VRYGSHVRHALGGLTGVGGGAGPDATYGGGYGGGFGGGFGSASGQRRRQQQQMFGRFSLGAPGEGGGGGVGSSGISPLKHPLDLNPCTNPNARLLSDAAFGGGTSGYGPSLLQQQQQQKQQKQLYRSSSSSSSSSSTAVPLAVQALGVRGGGSRFGGGGSSASTHGVGPDGQSGYRVMSRAELQRRLGIARRRRGFHQVKGAFRWWVRDRRRRARLRSAAALVGARRAALEKRRVLSLWTVGAMREAALNTARREAAVGEERRRLEAVASKLRSLEKGCVKLRERKETLVEQFESLRRFTSERSNQDRLSSEALRKADAEQERLGREIVAAKSALERADDERRRLVELVARARSDEAFQRAREAEAKGQCCQ
jgi:hypothetical protein